MQRNKWFTSSRTGNEGACVEVRYRGDAIDVRDTKDRKGPALTYTPEEWRAFVGGVKDGEFDI